jgi:dihydroflavonol-4-reductase
MRVLVTGASGFVGGHVARSVRQAGADVVTERVEVTDAAAVDRAVAACDAVVHVAALYSYEASRAELERANVDGTRNVVVACARHHARLVHTSTAGTCGPVRGRPATERDSPPGWELTVPYKRTKLEAERLVLSAARDGLDAVVVNPTAPVGEGDRRPTPTGRMIAGVACGRIRGYVSTTGLNVVDVRDVARGHALALEHGRSGERYLLGGENLPLGDLFARIAALSGRPRPRLRVAYPIAVAASRLGLLNRHEVRLARLPMYFSSAKAERELGYAPGPLAEPLERAVREALALEGAREPERERGEDRAAYGVDDVVVRGREDRRRHGGRVHRRQPAQPR